MNRLVSNTSWIVGCKFAQNVMSLIVSMLSARYLGPSNYGLINYATSIMNFVYPFVTMGINNILVQELVADKKNEGAILGSSLLGCTVTAVFGIVAVISVTSVINAGEWDTIFVVALYSLILIAQVWEMIQYWFQAKLLSKYYAVASLVAYSAVSAYKILLLIKGKSVYWFAVSYALDYLIIAILLFVCYKRLGGMKFQFSFSVLRALVKKSHYYIVSSLMVSFCAQTDKIMLKAMIDETATGLYSAATACAGLTSFVFAAIIDSFRPYIFKKKLEGNDRFGNSLEELYCIIIYLSLIQCIGITLLAKPIIYITYGAAYAASIPILKIAVWYTTFSYLGIVRNIWLLAEKKQQYLWIINLTGAIVNVALNALLIPKFQGNGAAVASLISQFSMNVIMGFLLKPIRPNNRMMIRGCNPKLILQMAKKIKKEE